MTINVNTDTIDLQNIFPITGYCDNTYFKNKQRNEAIPNKINDKSLASLF